MAVCWFGWRCVGLARAQLVAFVRKALTATLVGVLLCAPLLIAMIDYFGHADLWLHSTDFFSHVHLPAQGLPQLLLPYVYGPIFGFSDSKGKTGCRHAGLTVHQHGPYSWVAQPKR